MRRLQESRGLHVAVQKDKCSNVGVGSMDDARCSSHRDYGFCTALSLGIRREYSTSVRISRIAKRDFEAGENQQTWQPAV